MNPLENPWPVMALCAVIAAVLVFLAPGRSRKLTWLAAAVCLVAGVGVYLADQSIVTEREQVEQNVHDLCRAFQRQDIPALLNFFSAQAVTERGSVQSAARMVKVEDDLRVSDVQVELRGKAGRAISQFRANASLTVGSQSIGHHPSRWRLTWQREGEDWKIIGVQRIHPINGNEMTLFDGG